MRVTADRAVSSYVAARGGVLWVRSTRQRCCSGSLTTLRARTSRPRDHERYEVFECDAPFTLRVLAPAGLPEELALVLHGVGMKRPVALWDGCRFKP